MAAWSSGQLRLLLLAIVSVVLSLVVIVWAASALTPGVASHPSPTSVSLTERFLPGVIYTEGSEHWDFDWQWPIFNFNPCENPTKPGVNCTSLNVTLAPGGYYNFSFVVYNGGNQSAQLVDLESDVPFTYASVPAQYCPSGSVPTDTGPTVGPYSWYSIEINLTAPSTPGTFDPSLSLYTVMGSCTTGYCSWGC